MSYIYYQFCFSGHLILHLSKDTYQQLGLEGKPSQFPKRKKSKYSKVITYIISLENLQHLQWGQKSFYLLKGDYLCSDYIDQGNLSQYNLTGPYTSIDWVKVFNLYITYVINVLDKLFPMFFLFFLLLDWNLRNYKILLK